MLNKIFLLSLFIFKYIYKYIPFVEGLTTISANYGNASKVYVKTANLQVNPLPRVIHNIPIPNEKYKFNVYVSQDGTGDGVSIDNPTTLINAINNLQEYSIIHIANGFYNYDNLKITKRYEREKRKLCKAPIVCHRIGAAADEWQRARCRYNNP